MLTLLVSYVYICFPFTVEQNFLLGPVMIFFIFIGVGNWKPIHPLEQVVGLII